MDDAHKERLFAVVRAANRSAEADGQELQAEFGREAVALIVGCNQFVRVFRGGAEPGAVELLLDPPQKEALSGAGFHLKEPEGAVFRMFGWVRVDPMQGDSEALDAAVHAAFAKAQAAKKPA